MRSRQWGFTLIELIITIVVLSIIVMIAVPSFQNTINSQQQNSQFRQLRSVFELARSQALTLKQDVTVTLNSSENDTATALHWHAENNNRLVESTSPFEIVFTANGLVKDFDTTTTLISLCNTQLRTAKRMQFTRMGSVQLLADGSCNP